MNRTIIITPEFWAQPYKVKYHYARPDGTLWNVSSVDGDVASVWTINAWGQVYRQLCQVADLREVNHETFEEAIERVRKGMQS